MRQWTMKPARALAFVLGCLFPLSGVAQPDPADELGFAAEKAFHVGALDTVNEYNGNLLITIPIGQTYPVNGALSYAFTLSYNSKVWEFEQETAAPFWWHVIPARDSNMALGWFFSFGELWLSCQTGWSCNFSRKPGYYSSDGAVHGLQHTTLHYDDAPPASGGQNFTRDGTYIRLRAIGGNQYDVELANGTIQRFERIGNTNQTRLIQIRDQFGNAASLTETGNTVTVSDGHRQHTIEYEIITHPRENLTKRPKQITLAAFGGAKVVYRFTYTSTTFNRPCTFSYGIHPDDPMTIEVPVLSRIDAYTEADADDDPLDPAKALVSYDFSYYTDNGPTEYCRSGAISTMGVPTGAQTTYDYQVYGFPPPLCPAQASGLSTPGVWSRTINDGTTSGTWYYKTAIIPQTQTMSWICPGPEHHDNEIPEPEEVRRTIYTPAGDKIVNYFTGWADNNGRQSPTGAKKKDTGLPYVLRQSSNGKYLSKQFYDCTSFTVGTDRSISESGCVLQRTTYVSYERDANWGANLGQNSRLSGSRTEYTAPAGAFVDVTYTDFDGLGHYRKATSTSNLRATGVDDTVTFTNYNNGVGTYSTTADGTFNGNFVMPDLSSWILSTHPEKSVKRNGRETKTELSFDSATGALLTTRTMKNIATSPSEVTSDNTADIVVALCRDVSGNVTSERYFGGDRNSAADLPPSSPCTTTPNFAEGEYQINHTYSNGALATTSYSNATLMTRDRTIDASSGRAASMRDSAGVETSYDYDLLGRLIWIKPAGRAWTGIVWAKAGVLANPKARVTVTQWPNGGPLPDGNGNPTVADLTKQVYDYDGLGRLVREERKMPDGTAPYRTTTYDAAGNVTAVSEFSTNTSGRPETSYTGYDAFGRANTITAPDGKSTVLAYTGVSSTARTVQIATSASAESGVTTNEHYDSDGRVWRVVEKSGPTSASATTGADVTTSYDYDIGGRLARVTMGAATGTTQVREFSYDGRGFLTEERHPELGVDGGVARKTTFQQYDSRGHAAEKRLSLPGPFDLNYSYDSAERLTGVFARKPASHSNCAGTFVPVTSFQFATSNAGADLRKGKLVQAIRYNYLSNSRIYRVTEDLGYADTAGRLRIRTTTVADSTDCTNYLQVRSFNQAVSYSDLDAVNQIAYPSCTTCGPDPASPRTVTREYERGLLTRIPDFITNMQYHANGLVTRVDHSNGIADTQEVDTSGMARPRSIKFETWQTCSMPVIESQPDDWQQINQGQPASLSAAANGSPAPTYTWYRVDPGLGDVQEWTGQTYSPSPTTTTTYVVVVRNACGEVRSANAVVDVIAGNPPTITAGSPADHEIDAGSGATLTVSADGSSPLSYQWYQGTPPNGAVIQNATGAAYSTGSLTATTSYYVVVQNSFGTATSRVATVYVRPGAPGLLTATKDGNNVQLAWGAAAAPASYQIQRQELGTAFRTIHTASATTTAWPDPGCPVNVTFVYRIRALDGSGTRWADSNHELATMASYTSITQGMVVAFAHFDEMLLAVNRVRAAAGLGPQTWAGILDDSNPSTPPIEDPAVGRIVRAAHVAALRNAMDAARWANGIAPTAYTDANLAGKLISAVHLTDLQARTR